MVIIACVTVRTVMCHGPTSDHQPIGCTPHSRANVTHLQSTRPSCSPILCMVVWPYIAIGCTIAIWVRARCSHTLCVQSVYIESMRTPRAPDHIWRVFVLDDVVPFCVSAYTGSLFTLSPSLYKYYIYRIIHGHRCCWEASWACSSTL